METCSSSSPAASSHSIGSPEETEGGMEEHSVQGASNGGARPKQYSNVIVDDSPLQNQMEKNKECKFSRLCNFHS